MADKKITQRLNSLREEIKLAEVDLSCNLTEVELSLQEVLNLKEGDILPITMPEMVTLRAEDIPVLRGKVGESKGSKAVKIIESIDHTVDKELAGQTAASLRWGCRCRWQRPRTGPRS